MLRSGRRRSDCAPTPDALIELRLLLARLAPSATSSGVERDPRLEAARSALECSYLLAADAGAEGDARSPQRLDNLREALGAARAAVVAASWALRVAQDQQRLEGDNRPASR